MPHSRSGQPTRPSSEDIRWGYLRAQRTGRIRTDPASDRSIVPAGVHRRRHRRISQVEHRGLSESRAGHPGDHRAVRRLVGRGDGALFHRPHGGRPFDHARSGRSSFHLVLRAFLRPRHVQVRHRLLFRPATGGAQPAAERQPAERSDAADPGIEPGRRGVSLSGGRAAAFWADQSSHGPGLGVAAP